MKILWFNKEISNQKDDSLMLYLLVFSSRWFMYLKKDQLAVVLIPLYK